DDDGWPHMGERIDEVRGRPVAQVPSPGGERETSTDRASHPYQEPSRSDCFTSTDLHPRWHWQANPQPSWARTGAGRLELALGPSPRGDLRDLGQILSQQLPGQPSTWTTSVHLPAAPDGAVGVERAGVVVL